MTPYTIHIDRVNAKWESHIVPAAGDHVIWDNKRYEVVGRVFSPANYTVVLKTQIK